RAGNRCRRCLLSRPPCRSLRLRWRAIGLAAVLLACSPAAALAHATFVRSDPPDICAPLAVPRLLPTDPRCQSGVVLTASPAELRLTFNEPVQPVGRGIRL